MSPSGPLSQFRGHVSKTENIARIAALLQYFSQGEGKISADIMTSAVVISSWYTDEYKNYLRYLMNLNCSCRTPGSCSTGSLRSAAENARPCQEKLYSPVWPGPVPEQEKAERPAEHSCISTQALCRAGRKNHLCPAFRNKQYHAA